MEVIQYPLHDTEIFQKFLAGGNYNANDYAKVEKKEDEIPQEFRKEIIIKNGKITFGEDRNPVAPELISPSEADALTDYIIDVDYRVTMIELGL